MGTCHAMGGHRSLLMGVVWVWVQIHRKCWALVGSAHNKVVYLMSIGQVESMP